MRSSMTPKKPSRGCGIVAWSGGSSMIAARAREVRDVDAAWERMDVRVLMAFRFEQATARRSDTSAARRIRSASRSFSTAGAPLNADSSSMQS